MSSSSIADESRPVGFYRFAQHRPDRLAVVEVGGRSIEFGALLTQVNRLSNALRDNGVHPGERVAALLGNTIRFVELSLATAQVGVPFVPVNTHLTVDEIAYILDNSGSRFLFTDRDNLDAGLRAWTDTGKAADRVVVIDAEAPSGTVDYADFLRDRAGDAPADRLFAQPMLYTAGTTGRPKGTVWPVSASVEPEAAISAHETLMALRGMVYDPEATTLVSGPLYHGAPGVWATMALHHGHTVLLPGRWDSHRFLELVQNYRVSTAQLAPIHFHRLLKLSEAERTRYDTSSLRVVSHAGAATPVEVKQRMMDWLGPVLWEYYAASEGFGTSISPEDWLAHPGSVGRQDGNGASMKVLDEDGTELSAGEVGTLWIRNPTGTNSEYLGEPEKTAASRRGEYYTAGDMAYIDAEGWVFIVDRRTDLIISGAVNIYPAEVENVLRRHPDVSDVAVIGVPDEEWGQRVHAIVVPAEGVQGEPELVEDIRRFAAGELAGFKVPRSMDFQSSLPYSEAGKLLRRALRDR